MYVCMYVCMYVFEQIARYTMRYQESDLHLAFILLGLQQGRSQDFSKGGHRGYSLC